VNPTIEPRPASGRRIGRRAPSRRPVESGDATPGRPVERGRGARQTSCSSFLDALYIPQRLRIAPELLWSLRCKAGNRANAIAVTWERAETRARSLRWVNLLVLPQRKDEHWTAFLRSLLVTSALLSVSLLGGLELQGALDPPEHRTPAPKAFSMTSSVQRPSRTTAPHEPVMAHRAEVLQNDLGQVVEVRASDPGAVLVGFCRTMMVTACDPVELAWSEPPHPQLRLGVYHDEFTKRAIQIRRNPTTRQWVAGDGQQAIENFLASSLRMSDDRLRVRDTY
jgi:hypothetical protein